MIAQTIRDGEPGRASRLAQARADVDVPKEIFKETMRKKHDREILAKASGGGRKSAEEAPPQNDERFQLDVAGYPMPPTTKMASACGAACTCERQAVRLPVVA